MAKRDLYEILGLDRNASQDQVKKAFRNKARHLHPDNMDSGDEAAFKELAAAYEVLSDERKRSLYDRYGHDGLSGGAGGFDGVDLGGFADLSEIFAQFFGGGPRGGSRHSTVDRGADLKYDLQLDFLEAVFGLEKTISVKHLEGCTVCTGSGAAPGSSRNKCATCNGQGQIRQSTSTFLGQFTQVISCPNCEGEGSRVEKPCSNCKGRGQVRQSRDIELKVPAGVDSGLRMRVAGAGDQARRGGVPGDLYVVLQVTDHPDFIREGTTIHLRQSISFSMAALGGELMVPTVEGAKAIKIPAGTQTGTTLVMKEHGVPYLNTPGKRGDQIIHLQVDTPTRLSSEEKKLLEKLAELRKEQLHLPKGQKTEETSKENSSILDKISDVFRGKDGQ